VRKSMIFPFPSSPHWAPTRMVFGISRVLENLLGLGEGEI